MGNEPFTPSLWALSVMKTITKRFESTASKYPGNFFLSFFLGAGGGEKKRHWLSHLTTLDVSFHLFYYCPRANSILDCIIHSYT